MTFRISLALAGLTTLLFFGEQNTAASQSFEQSLEYPKAKKVDHTDLYHGTTVADPYRWMEQLDSDDLRQWINAEAAYTKSYVESNDYANHIKHRLDTISDYATMSLPVRAGRRLFVVQRQIGENFGSLVVRGEYGDDSALLNLEKMNSGDMTVSVSSYDWSGSQITYLESEGQSRWAHTRIYDVETKQTLNDKLVGFYRGRSNIAWMRDGSGFFYPRYEVPEDPQALLGRPSVFFHKVGTEQAHDRLVFEVPDDRDLTFTLRTTFDSRFLVITGSYSGGNFLGMEDRIFIMDLEAKQPEAQELFADVDATFAFESSRGEDLFFRTSLGAPSLRLVKVNLSSPSTDHWVDIVDAQESTMQAVSEVGDFFAIRYVEDARMIVKIYDVNGQLKHEIDEVAPSIYGLADDRTSDVTFYGVSSFYRPSTTYTLNVRTSEKKIYFEPDLLHDADNFVTTQVFYKSEDGTRVPMYLIHRSDMKLDGTNPVFMYAYGAWGWSAFPWQWYMIPWVEMGGIYAVPGIRGGGEYGDAWYKGGARLNKERGIEDYIAAAEYLISEGYSSPEILAANGGSASGVLPAVAAIRRPDLFGASVVNFPTLDKLRYINFGSAKSWVSEFGDPANPDDFKALFAYSPLHNLVADSCYPATWVQVGENDNTTTPMHGYKYVAALQDVQNCSNPILLKVAWGAGHSYGSTPDQSRRTQAEELAFLVDVFKMQDAVMSLTRAN